MFLTTALLILFLLPSELIDLPQLDGVIINFWRLVATRVDSLRLVTSLPTLLLAMLFLRPFSLLPISLIIRPIALTHVLNIVLFVRVVLRVISLHVTKLVKFTIAVAMLNFLVLFMGLLHETWALFYYFFEGFGRLRVLLNLFLCLLSCIWVFNELLSVLFGSFEGLVLLLIVLDDVLDGLYFIKRYLISNVVVS